MADGNRSKNGSQGSLVVQEKYLWNWKVRQNGSLEEASAVKMKVEETRKMISDIEKVDEAEQQPNNKNKTLVLDIKWKRWWGLQVI